jgi:hypothetical protein
MCIVRGALGVQTNDIGSVTASQNGFVEGTAVSCDGESGGPLWIWNGSTAQAVGIVTGPGTSDLQLTSSDVTTIQGLEAIPILTLANSSLRVTAGGSVAMGINVVPVDSDDTVSVTISGLPGFETITAGDGHLVAKHGGSYTFTAADVSSGLTLNSSFRGKGHPVNALTVTATNSTAGESATSSPQFITVTDPPATATPPNAAQSFAAQLSQSVLNLGQSMASFGAARSSSADSFATTLSASVQSMDQILATPHMHAAV